MDKINTEALYLSEDIILDIINKSQKIKTEVDNLNFRRGIFETGMNQKELAAKAITLYHKAYKKVLNDAEKSVLILYVLISNDEAFLKQYLKCKANFKEIGKYFGVSKEYAYLRWLIYRKIKKYENNLIETNKDTKKLSLTNKQKNDNT